MRRSGLLRVALAKPASVTFLDDGVVVATRDAEIKITGPEGPIRIEGRLLGGRDAARGIPPRKLFCKADVLGPDPVPCVVRSEGQIHFLPADAPGDPGSVPEPRGPRPSGDDDKDHLAD